jgi:superfamily I DNA/RNA helicase
MSQATLDDDELFTEAASEMRADVEDSLDSARDSLPDAEAVWEIDSDNTLGALNALKSALDVGDARDHLRDAKKWFTMGKKADAFEDSEDLAAEITDVEDLIADIEDAGEQVGDLASTIPQLKSALETDDEDDATDAEAETAEA